MFKKLIGFIVSLSLVIGLCGCSDSGNNSSGDKLEIVTTVFPAYDFARQVFGDTANVTLLLKPGMESHSYDPSARDIVRIENCDLFIFNGGESDAWVENILGSTNNVNILRMMDMVEVYEEEITEGMEHDHDGNGSDDHVREDDEYDEHIWTSPKNAAKIVDGIRTAAVKLSPGNEAAYNSAANDYIGKINALDDEFRILLEGENRYFVFGDRFPLLYFFREYDLNYYAAFPGCGSETEPSARVITFLGEKLESADTVPAVFYIELSNHKLADTLASEKGLSSYEFHTCHNLTADDFEAGETYVSLMERNVNTLKTVLGKGE